MKPIILTAAANLIACFWFYACAINRNAWVKVRNLLTANAIDHRYLLRDERYIRSCQFQAVSAGIMVVILTVFLVRMLMSI
jgi:hypothetical protein